MHVTPAVPDGSDLPTAHTLAGISEIDEAVWDACAGGDNPFVSHAFLSALEESGACAPDTGWQPQHMVVEDPSGEVIAAAPLYLKGHSYGE